MQEDSNSGDEGTSSKPENDNKIAVENAFYEAQDLEVRLCRVRCCMCYVCPHASVAKIQRFNVLLSIP